MLLTALDNQGRRTPLRCNSLGQLVSSKPDADDAEYLTVAASQTDSVLGGGAKGDYLAALLIIPATSAAGAVSIKDGSNSISVFAGGGTTALTDLKPFRVEIGLKSLSGPWKVTTGTNVSVVAIGNFTSLDANLSDFNLNFTQMGWL
jgi:hypothetical protein